MGEVGAAIRTEKSVRSREEGGGTAHGPGNEHQTPAAGAGNVGELSTKLMEEMLHRKNMMTAHNRVRRNRGAPGVDGMTVDQLMPHCRERWARIREELLAGRYHPQPVLRVDIPKPGGKGVRTLGIPTVLDRLIQQALLQVLQPIFDPTFSDASFGFRPKRSALHAVQRARAHIAAGHRWVVDLDLEKFFDRVNHDMLMARVARKIKDKRVLRLIRRYLTAGMLADGVVLARVEGTPQGGPLSPLLSNVLLDELDRELQRRGHRFVRYADDVNVYVRSKAAGERVLASIERFLWKRLRLKVNREKSAVDRPWKRQFLGYSVTNHRKPKLRVSPKAIKRFRLRLRGIFRRGRGRSLSSVIEELAPVLRGWMGYFRLAETKGQFPEMDSWVRRKLRCTLWRHWKQPRTRYRELVRRGIFASRAKLATATGRGPWWNAGSSHMHQAVSNRVLEQMGLVSLTKERRRYASLL